MRLLEIIFPPKHKSLDSQELQFVLDNYAEARPGETPFEGAIGSVKVWNEGEWQTIQS